MDMRGRGRRRSLRQDHQHRLRLRSITMAGSSLRTYYVHGGMKYMRMTNEGQNLAHVINFKHYFMTLQRINQGRNSHYQLLLCKGSKLLRVFVNKMWQDYRIERLNLNYHNLLRRLYKLYKSKSSLYQKNSKDKCFLIFMTKNQGCFDWRWHHRQQRWWQWRWFRKKRWRGWKCDLSSLFRN